MVRIYFDKQIFSHLFKQEKTQYVKLLNQIRKQKSSLFCYSHAHLRDLKNDKTDIKYSDFANYLLVLNRRDGLMTSSSDIAGHWPRKILKTSNLYPEDIDLFILNNPNFFRLLWSNNSIYVYQLISK